MTLPVLAPELILDILELLRRDVSTLKNTSLVCKDWSYLAQRQLYRRVNLVNESELVRFRLLISRDDKGNFLGTCVRVLHIGLSMDTHMNEFVEILALCPNIRELDLDMSFTEMVFKDETLATLQKYCQPTALRIRWSGYTHIRALLGIWPSLEHLDIYVLPGIHFDPAAPSVMNSDSQSPVFSSGPVPPQCSLHELRWFEPMSTSDSSQSILPWVLHSTAMAGSLRILAFLTSPNVEQFTAVMKAHGAHLRSLGVPDFEEPEAAEAVRECTALEEFKCFGPPALRLLNALPRTLEHFEFQSARNGYIRPRFCFTKVIEFIESLPHIRDVTFRPGRGDDSESVRELELLKEVCRKKQANLRIFCLREGEDLVRTKKFPRCIPGAEWMVEEGECGVLQSKVLQCKGRCNTIAHRLIRQSIPP